MINLRKHIRFLAVLLIPVYFVVLGSSIKNRHTHVLPNGLVITHSHPFTDDNGQPVKHGHTRNQILFLQLFTFDFFDSSPETFLPQTLLAARTPIFFFYTESFDANNQAVTLLRGPPLG